MLRTWVFEFFPELTVEDAEITGLTPSQYAESYLSLWERDEILGFDEHIF